MKLLNVGGCFGERKGTHLWLAYYQHWKSKTQFRIQIHYSLNRKGSLHSFKVLSFINKFFLPLWNSFRGTQSSDLYPCFLFNCGLVFFLLALNSCGFFLFWLGILCGLNNVKAFGHDWFLFLFFCQFVTVITLLF